MLMHLEVFLLAVFGCAVTNVDNMLLVLSSGGRLRATWCALVFLTVLTLAILLGQTLSLGLDQAGPRFIAWVGLLPLGMGVYELLPWLKRGMDQTTHAAGTALALGVTLAANSLDTVAVQAALFSDFSTAFHITALLGAFTTACTFAGLSLYLLSHSGIAERLLPMAAKVRPWLLIVVGLLLLNDTGYDAV